MWQTGSPAAKRIEMRLAWWWVALPACAFAEFTTERVCPKQISNVAPEFMPCLDVDYSVCGVDVENQVE